MNCVPWNFALFTAPVALYLYCMPSEAADGALQACFYARLPLSLVGRRRSLTSRWLLCVPVRVLVTPVLRAVLGLTTSLVLSVVCLALFVATAYVLPPCVSEPPLEMPSPRFFSGCGALCCAGRHC
jgi:hypothetical protein